MKPITPPLDSTSHGAEVANLQDALLFLLVTLTPGMADAERQRFAAGVATERRGDAYGPQTMKLVTFAQRQAKLPETGAVDPATADALNVLLKELNAFPEPAPPQPDQPPAPARFNVSGTVSSPDRAGVGGLRVQIVDKNAGPDAPIPGAEAVTDDRGEYNVAFPASALPNPGKIQPDLQARVFAGETFLAASPVHYYAGMNETLDVRLTANSEALPTEYETLTAALAKYFPGRLGDLKEGDERQDITYLANRAGWDARAVAMAALADQFSLHMPPGMFPPAFFYALFRAGIPTNDDAVYHTAAERLIAIWNKAIDQGVIPKTLKELIPAMAERFQNIGAQRLLSDPAVTGVSPLKDMLAVSRLDPSLHSKFAELYAANRADMPTFWKAAGDAFGPETTTRLQVDGKLGFLTINNAPLMDQLHQAAGGNGISDPVQLAQMGFHRPEKWAAFVKPETAIPKEIPGDTPVAKLANYCSYQAAQVRLSYPTASVAEMIKSGMLPLPGSEANAPTVLHDFLMEHHDKFVIGTQPLEQYISRNKLQLSEETLKVIKQHFKPLERVYQITPSDEAAAGMMKRGLDSAFKVVQHEKERFVSTFAADLGGELAATQTYNKAVQVHNAVLNIAIGYLSARTAPGIGVHSPAKFIDPTPAPPDPQAAHAADILSYPALEQLFGSMDFCACDHCRSILSPAAYLVDLLQFLDREPSSSTEVSPLQVLLNRRPDIQHIPLTCENTNTTLPYIDVVNEILEYFIVNKLSMGEGDGEYQGHDTGDALSEDLMASPQYVMDAAYDILEGETFPAPLPFNQPLESLRRYFNTFGVPLPLAMDRLRKGEESAEEIDKKGWREILIEEACLSPEEEAVLTADLLTKIYGFAPGEDAKAIATLSNAQRFARRMDIAYEDLSAILQTQFINPNSVLIPKLERLQVSFADMRKLKEANTPEADAAFDKLLSANGNAPNPGEFGGDVKAWIKDNYDRIMKIIMLTVPSWGASTLYLAGDCVTPTAQEQGSTLYYECTSEGISGDKEPTSWPTEVGTKQLDGAGALAWECKDDLNSSTFGTLAVRYTNPDPAKLSQPIASVDFVRLLRFIRLWKKLGWTIEQTDAAICCLLPVPSFPLEGYALDQPDKLDSSFLDLLPRLGMLVRVMKTLNLSVKRDLSPLLNLWGDIRTHGANSLYRRMFLNQAVLQQDPLFGNTSYGSFLQRMEVSYSQDPPVLDQAVVNAASGRLFYDHARSRLSFSRGSNATDILARVIATALKNVPGVSQPFKTAVDELYASQFLATHAESLRGALNVTEREFSAITAHLEYITEISAPLKAIDALTLDQAVYDAAPGLFYDPAGARLKYPGVLASATRDAVQAIPGISDAIKNGVDALFQADTDVLTPLTLAHISAIYRRAWLARALKISVDELLLLTQLTGLDPFDVHSSAILRLMNLIQSMKDRSIKSAVALYLVWNQDLSGNSAPSPAQLAEIARTLRADHAAIDDQLTATGDPSGDLLQSRLALVYSPDAANAFLSLLDDTQIMHVNYVHDQESLSESITKADPQISYDNLSHVLTYAGILTEAERDALTGIQGVSEGFKTGVEALFQRSEDIKGSFFALIPELKLLYDSFINLKAPVLEAPYTHSAPTLEAVITGIDSKLTYDDQGHKLVHAGFISSDLHDRLKGVKDASSDYQAAMDALFVMSQDEKKLRHENLLTVFKPELSRRLKRQQTVQRLSAAASLDLASIVALMDPGQGPFQSAPSLLPLHAIGRTDKPALDDLTAIETAGLEARFYFRNQATGTIDLTVPAAANLSYASGANPLQRNLATPGDPVSGIWIGQIEIPEAGFYNIAVEADSGSTVTLNLGGQSQSLIRNGNLWRNAGALDLKEGTLYEIILTVENVREVLRVQWESSKKPREVIPARYLYSPSVFSPFSRTYTRLLKIASLAEALGLSTAEIVHFGTDPDYFIGISGGLNPTRDGWLNFLPVSDDPPSAAAPDLLKPFQALLDFARIKARLSPGTETLLAILNDPLKATANSRSSLYVLTRWDVRSLGDLLAYFGGNVAGLGRFSLFRRVHDAFDLIQTMGIPASAFIRAATNSPAGQTVRDFQDALRARYDPASWREAVQPINDGMRDLRRDALVAYILQKMRSNPKTEHINTADKLFEYFLTDVQMEPCMQTSRIRHVLSSVQLFIERCLMNLETEVPSTLINAKQWEWMKRYRVWEANRKIFLFPENWAEPELRDDKSPFFKEAESELLQSDITEDSAATALLNYLSKLQEVAQLEPCGIYHEEGDENMRTSDVDHVIARTAGAHRKYYYRKKEGGAWTPWEQIKLDIEDAPVIPVVWKGEHGSQLLLFWLRILKQAPLAAQTPASDRNTHLTDVKVADISTKAQQFKVQAVLCWSERYNDKWQPVKTSDLNQPIDLGTFDHAAGNNPFDRSEWRLRSMQTPKDLRILTYSTTGEFHPLFLLYNTHGLPEPLLDSYRSGKSGDTPDPVRFFPEDTEKSFEGHYEDFSAPPPLELTILTKLPSFDVVTQMGRMDSWEAPFALIDKMHVFFVETTVEPGLFFTSEHFGATAAVTAIKGSEIPPLVLHGPPKTSLGPNLLGDGGPIDPSTTVIDSAKLQDLVNLGSSSIRRAIVSTDVVTFSGKQIGPSGLIPLV